MDRFENKVVLITGAGDVAGAAAKRMMAEGARIAFADFSQQALDQAAADLQAAGFSAERILCVQCDVRSMDSCRKMGADRHAAGHCRHHPPHGH